MNAIGHSSAQILKSEIAENRTWLWARIAVAFALLECALWTAAQTQQAFSLICLGWVVGTTIAERHSLDDLGLGVRGLRGASIALLFTAVAFAIMVTIAAALGTLGQIHGAHAVRSGTGYIVWSFLQEFLLNSYFFLGFEKLLGGSRKAMWASVFLFVFAHIPNPVLMLATLVLSFTFVSIFRRYRNVYPLGLGHAILGMTIAICVPARILEHMRVGLGYVHLVFK
jgi:hypothetical protein